VDAKDAESAASSQPNVVLIASVACVAVVVILVVAVAIVVARRRRKLKSARTDPRRLSTISRMESPGYSPQHKQAKRKLGKRNSEETLLQSEADTAESLQLSLVRAEVNADKEYDGQLKKQTTKAEFQHKLQGIIATSKDKEAEDKAGIKKARMERLNMVEKGHSAKSTQSKGKLKNAHAR